MKCNNKPQPQPPFSYRPRSRALSPYNRSLTARFPIRQAILPNFQRPISAPSMIQPMPKGPSPHLTSPQPLSLKNSQDVNLPLLSQSFIHLPSCTYSILFATELNKQERRGEWHRMAKMAPTYYSNHTSSTRDHFIEPPSLISRLISALPSGLSAQMARVFDSQSASYSTTTRIPRSLRRFERNLLAWSPRRLLSLPHAFIVVWVVLLLWGERWVFKSAVEECRWENWERWVGVYLSFLLARDLRMRLTIDVML